MEDPEFLDDLAYRPRDGMWLVGALLLIAFAALEVLTW